MHRLKNDPCIWRKGVSYYSTGYTLAIPLGASQRFIHFLTKRGEPSTILVPRASWRPEYEDQEALGTQDLKSWSH